VTAPDRQRPPPDGGRVAAAGPGRRARDAARSARWSRSTPPARSTSAGSSGNWTGFAAA